MSIPGVDLRVEIAFNAGYRTAAVDRVWTDVSDYVELKESLSITYGRTDEVSVADANQLALTLDNTDARFTYGNASSPYYPNLKIGRPIRVTAIVDAVEYVRFTGYINEWPVEWPTGGDEYASASITASSRLSRLGLDSPLRPLVDHVIQALPSLVAYFPLIEPVDSTFAVESSGNAGPNAEMMRGGVGTALPVFGATEGGFDDRPYVTFGTGSAALSSVPWSVAPATITVSAFFKTPGPAPVAALQTVVEYRGVRLYVDPSGEVTAYPGGATYLHSTSVVANDAWHHAALTYDGVTHRLYIDGVEEDTAVAAAPAYFTNGASIGVLAPDAVDAISVGRFAVHGAALTAAQVQSLVLAGMSAYSGDTTDERLERYAEWASIPTAELTTTASPVAMAAVTTESSQIVDLMRQVETTEAGVLHDDRDGNLVLHSRAARYGVPVGLTLDTAGQWVESDYAPKVDRQGLANFGRGTNTLGTVEATYTNEPSREEYGDASYDVETAALSPDEPLQLAAWVINGNSEPRPRVPSVTLKINNWIDDPDLSDVLGVDIGTKVRVANAPTQAPDATTDYFAEGYTETFAEVGWSMALNLSPASPHDSVFILDDATFGELDSTNLLAL